MSSPTAADGRLHIIEPGCRYAAADILRAKEQRATLAVEQAPLVRSIVRQLRRSEHGSGRAEEIVDQLQRAYTDDYADTQLDAAIDSGRYGELFEYDADTERLLLPAHPDPSLRPAALSVRADCYSQSLRLKIAYSTADSARMMTVEA